MRREMLARYIHGSHKKIGIFGIDDDRFQAFQHCQMYRLACLITQFHQDGPGGFTYRVGIEDTGSQCRHVQAQSVFMTVLILHQ